MIERGWPHRALGAWRFATLPLAFALLLGVNSAALAAEPAVFGLAERAKSAYERGDFAEAARLYRAAYAADPSHPEALYGVGLAEQRAGRCDEALQALHRLGLALAPEHPLHARAAAVRARCPQPAPAPAPVTATGGGPEPAASVPPPAPTPSIAQTLHARSLPAAPPPSRSAPVWRLATSLGLLGAGAAAAGWAGWSTAALDRQLGQLDGRSAAAEQRTINAWSGLAVGAIVSGVGVLAWHLLADPAANAVPGTSPATRDADGGR